MRRAARRAGLSGMVKVPSLAVPQLGSCASSGRAWQPWADRHSQGRDRPTERPATASGAQASHLQSRRFHRLGLFRLSESGAEVSEECARLRAALEASREEVRVGQEEVRVSREEVRATRLEAAGAGAAAEAAAVAALRQVAGMQARLAVGEGAALVGGSSSGRGGGGGGGAGGSAGGDGSGGGGGDGGGGGGGAEEAQQLAEELVAVREELIAVRAAHAKQLKQAQAELRKALTAASRQAEGRGEAGGDNQRGEAGAAAAMRVMHEREVSGRQ